MLLYDPTKPCLFCGEGIHVGYPCPHVKGLAFDPTTGAVVGVEFFSPADLNPVGPGVGGAPENAQPDYPRLGPKGQT